MRCARPRQGNQRPPPPHARRRRGLDAARLDQALERAATLPSLHALLVARAGEERVAEVFRGPGLDRPVNVKSVSKSVMAALAGAAIARGVLDGVDQRIAPILDDLVPRDADPRVGAITVDHLLTMRAGLERTSGPNYGRWVSSPNWVRHVLSRPFVDQPGGRMLYSTGSYHLLSAVLTRAAGRSTLELARAWLGEPLGIDIPPWTRDPQGFYLGGNNMLLAPRALLRFGEAYRLGAPRRQPDAARQLDRSIVDAAHAFAVHRPSLWLRLVHRSGARPSGLLRVGLRRADDLRCARPRAYGGHDLERRRGLGSRRPCAEAARA